MNNKLNLCLKINFFNASPKCMLKAKYKLNVNKRLAEKFAIFKQFSLNCKKIVLNICGVLTKYFKISANGLK